MPPDAAIAIANPIDGDHVQMTNHAWSFSIEGTRRQLGLARLLLVNDFTALALALPSLDSASLRQVGGAAQRAGLPRALLGAGSGLGVSGLIPDGRGGWIPLQGEGGHVTLAGRTPREDAVIGVLAERYGHPSAERACSGPGLVAIHAALRTLDRVPQAQPPLTPSQVLQAGLDGSDPLATEALRIFCAFLGTTAGNLALSIGALGGVYIGGGIVPRLGRWFDTSPYRERFEAKGRFRDYLAAIPTLVITAEISPALAGVSAALDR